MLQISQKFRPATRVAVALFAAFFLSAGLAAGPVSADDTDGISGAPANETGADSRTRFSYQVGPGQHIDDNYIVRNTGTTDQTMTVFATDAYNTDDGSYGLLDTDAEAVDAGGWVSFAGGAKSLEIPLAAGGSQLVPFAVDVPADASPGDHAAGIVISVVSPEGDILVDRRVATRLYVRVPGDLQASLTISSVAATYTAQLNPLAGTTTITYSLRNNGNVALGGTMVAGANTYFGIPAATPVRYDLEEMLPGSTRSFTIDVPGVAQLGYLNPFVRIAPSVDDEAINPGPIHEVSRDTVAFAMPWWLLALVVLGLIVWVTIVIRRSRDEKNAAEWIAYTEDEARRKALETPEATPEATSEATPGANDAELVEQSN